MPGASCRRPALHALAAASLRNPLRVFRLKPRVRRPEASGDAVGQPIRQNVEMRVPAGCIAEHLVAVRDAAVSDDQKNLLVFRGQLESHLRSIRIRAKAVGQQLRRTAFADDAGHRKWPIRTGIFRRRLDIVLGQFRIVEDILR